MFDLLGCGHRAIWPGRSSQRELRKTVSREGTLHLNPQPPFFAQLEFPILTPHFSSPTFKHHLQNDTKQPPSLQPPLPAPSHVAISPSPPKSPLEPTPPSPTALIKHLAFSLTLPLNSTPSPIHKTRFQPLLPTAVPAPHHQTNKPPRPSFSSHLPLPPRAVSSTSSISPQDRPPPRALFPLSPRVKLSRSKLHTSPKLANSMRSSVDAKLRSRACAMQSARARTAAQL